MELTCLKPIEEDELKRIWSTKLAPGSLCANCQRLDLKSLFSQQRSYNMGTVRQCFFSRFFCPVCDYVAVRVSEAHRDLDLETDIFQKKVTYSIHSRASQSDLEGVRTFHTAIIRLKGPGTGMLRTLSFTLTNVPTMSPLPGKRCQYLIRRPLAACLETSQLQEWIHTCDRAHARCKIPTDKTTLLQRRLVDLQRRGRFRLIDVHSRAVFQTSAEHHLTKYFALSYVWGQAMHRHSANTFYRTEPTALSSNSGNMFDLPGDIPRTIEDAMLLIRNLGGQYLWVDFFCINQKDEHEKSDVISQMGVIYQSAYATIVAATGNDADAGLPSLHQNPNRTEEPKSFRVNNDTFELLEPSPSIEKLLQRTSLNKRAWTYQEYHLSRRRILIFESEVAFTCLEGLQREAYVLCLHGYKRQPKARPIPKAASLLTRQMVGDRSKARNLYAVAVENYSKRGLTNNADRLNAFMGVYDMMTGGSLSPIAKHALCGLPQEIFLYALLWHVPDHRPPPSRIVPQDEGMRQLPTWCWAAWSSTIAYSTNARQVNEMFHIIDKGLAGGMDRLLSWTVEVIDEANLKLRKRQNDPNSEEHCWPQEPLPHVPEISGMVTLHIWAPLCECKLVRRFDFSEQYGFNLAQFHMNSESGLGAAVGACYANIAWLAEHDGESFAIILFPDCYEAIVAQRVGDFFERVPVEIKFYNRRNWSGVFQEKEHIELR